MAPSLRQRETELLHAARGRDVDEIRRRICRSRGNAQTPRARRPTAFAPAAHTRRRCDRRTAIRAGRIGGVGRTTSRCRQRHGRGTHGAGPVGIVADRRDISGVAGRPGTAALQNAEELAHHRTAIGNAHPGGIRRKRTKQDLTSEGRVLRRRRRRRAERGEGTKGDNTGHAAMAELWDHVVASLSNQSLAYGGLTNSLPRYISSFNP